MTKITQRANHTDNQATDSAERENSLAYVTIHPNLRDAMEYSDAYREEMREADSAQRALAIILVSAVCGFIGMAALLIWVRA